MDTRRRPLVLLAGIVWLIVLGCRTGDLIASRQPTATSTATRTARRPTFTRVPPTIAPPPTVVLAPTSAPILPAPAATLRPTPTHTRIPAPTSRPAPSATPLPPPTADLYQGFYYRISKNVCTTAPNTRAVGTVYNNGVPQNGVRVRVSGDGNGGQPAIDDFVTGTDPNDYKHTDPALQGKYQLGIFEGQQNAGNWWVWIIDDKGNALSPGAFFNTHDTNGCNTAIIDFVH